MKIAIEKPLLKSLALMASMIEARDAYTGGHLWRVSQYCRQLAEAAGMEREMVFLAGLGGFLHDIGKVAIPDEILGKRGELDDREYEVVKTHPGIGTVLLQEHPLGDLALAAVHQHHEWIDGSGYPQRLAGDRISPIARIVSIADAFDALTSTRPYRRETTAASAAAALQKERGTQFDGKLLDVFLDWVNTGAAAGVVGHSDVGVAMLPCPACGPVIAVSTDARAGDTAYCRICGTAHRLHPDKGTFSLETLPAKASAEELRPRPETRPIEAFLKQAPALISI